MELNNLVIGGNLTRDPELRRLPNSDQSVCNLSLAVNHRHKDRLGQAKEEVYFFDVECWGKTAEVVAQHLRKGRGIVVIGRIKQHRWETPEGNRSKVYIVADSVQFLPGGPQSPPAGEASGQAAAPAAGEPSFDFDA